MVPLALFIMPFSFFYISSDTGTKPPESCVFGLLLNMAAALCKFRFKLPLTAFCLLRSHLVKARERK